MIKIFFKRDNKDKIRIVELSLNKIQNSDSLYYTITGETGLYGGKTVSRPVITINKGKVKRTVTEQAELQYNSICSNYLDKGYKSQEQLNIINYSDAKEVENKVPKVNTDTNGNLKPMLAKHYKDVSNMNWDKKWLCSFKLDGVRGMLFNKSEGPFISSRGGGDYNVAAHYILTDSYLNDIFNKYPDIILDGELYIHGKPLSYISGLCRLKDLDEKHKELEFHCYDIVDESKPFKDRLEILNVLKSSSPLNSRIKFVLHKEISGRNEIFKYHEYAVQLGYEGLVLRDPDQCYKCGSRDRMYKLKEFQDSEYQIVGMSEGLREEDFVFNLVTKEGYPFQAKPKGDRELKKWYRENIDKLIGKMMTVKYFGYTTTEHPVPNLPVAISLRDKTDL